MSYSDFNSDVDDSDVMRVYAYICVISLHNEMFWFASAITFNGILLFAEWKPPLITGKQVEWLMSIVT